MESPFRGDILKGKVALLTGGGSDQELGMRYRGNWENMEPPSLSWVDGDKSWMLQSLLSILRASLLLGLREMFANISCENPESMDVYESCALPPDDADQIDG